MKITYNGEADINIDNMLPSNKPLAIKTFTLTGNNTTNIEMGYKISLVISSNDFSENALKYKLISTNTDNNETSSTEEGSTSWFGDNSKMPSASSPWFYRGGYWSNGDIAGLFHFHYSAGAAYINNSFRAVVFLQK